MKIVYAGSPLASAVVLKKLIAFSKSQEASGKIEIAGVLTNPPSAKGRKKELTPTEVGAVARAEGIPVFEFDHLLSGERGEIAKLNADLLVSFDFGRIFGPKFLSVFRLGGINLHPSALPKYRGCSPVTAAILNGDDELGICVQKIALKTDEGDILARDSVRLRGDETFSSLMDGDGNESVVTSCGAKLLIQVLKTAAELHDGEMLEGEAQYGDASWTNFVKKEDGVIKWEDEASAIERRVRAYFPWPVCSTLFNGEKLSILKAEISPESTAEKPGTVLPYRKSTGIEIACGNGTVLVVKELQLQGKKAMDYKSFVNGARDFFGALLG